MDTETILLIIYLIPVVAVLVFIYHILARLTMPNPFDRVFRKKPYEIIDGRTSHPDLHLKAPGKWPSLSVLKNAVYEAMYSNDDIDALTVTTDVRYPFRWEDFASFRFLVRLDLRKYIITNDHEFDVVGYVESLTIPEIARSIQFAEDCHELRDLFIPCRHYVPAYQFRGKPVIVANGFTVHVPSGLLDSYKDSADWSRINFVSSRGDLIIPRFQAAFSPAYFNK